MRDFIESLRSDSETTQSTIEPSHTVSQTNTSTIPTLGEAADMLSGEAGVTRRGALAAIILAGAAAYTLKACHKDDGPRLGSKDILANPDATRAFINEYQDIAETLAEKEGRHIPYEVFLAVGLHESESGTSPLAQKANNLHGIVAKDGWDGEIYADHLTEEAVNEAGLKAYQEQLGEDRVTILYRNEDGTIRIKVPRPFRKYATTKDSFRDFQNKIYFQNTNGSYRYDDVVGYIQSGGRDPYKVAELMSDHDTPGEASYASGPEWLTGVTNYIAVVQAQTGHKSSDTELPDNPSLPPEQHKIDMDKISFDNFDEPRDKKLIETIKEALSSLSDEDFKRFNKDGVKDKTALAREIVSETAAGGKAKYNEWYNGDAIEVEYLIWHLWQIGVENSGSPDSAPKGKSKIVSMQDQIKSWARPDGSHASTQFMLGGGDQDGEIWQLSKTPATICGHVRDGVMDEGSKTRKDVSNHNTVAIETCADSIYNVSVEQFKKLILWTTQQLLEQGIVDDGMQRDKVDAIIDHSVIGHGKNDGLEFGYKYTRPLIQALQQYIFIAMQVA